MQRPPNHLHSLGLRRVAVRFVGAALRLHGRDGHRHERAVPRSGRAAHQRRDRHRRGARADRLQPSDRRPAADPLHLRGAVRHVVNG